ncbi:MAG: lysylphosphatidylglycerol synthase domain-containing protein, partial [Kiloniellales bacterium]
MLRLSMLLVGLALLALVLSEVDLVAVWHGLLTLGLWGALAVVAIYFVAFLIDTASWQLTLPNAELTLSWLYRLWKVRMVGEALNAALPAASLGGEPVKALLLKRSQQVSYRESGASLIITRTVNLLALVLFSGTGFLLLLAKGAELPSGYRLGAGLGLGGLSFGVFAFYAIQH